MTAEHSSDAAPANDPGHHAGADRPTAAVTATTAVGQAQPAPVQAAAVEASALQNVEHETPQPVSFNLARLVHLVAQMVLMGAITFALRAFTHTGVALAIAGVLTYLFSAFAGIVVRRSGFWLRIGALAGLIAVGTTTTSLSYSTYYAKVTADASAKADFNLQREKAEREVQRVLSLADSAHGAMEAWAKDATTKADQEADKSGGNSCPGRASKGTPGPINAFRRDDATLANALATDLKSRTDALRAPVEKLSSLPKPKDFKAVTEAMVVVNQALDLAARLSAGDGFVKNTLTTLGNRKSTQIDYPNGQRVNCGDSGRLALIDSASLALSELNNLQPLPRLSATVDLANPQDVVTRGLLRGGNLTLKLVSFGHAGQFADDQLMTSALKKGVYNMETSMFALSLLAELGTLMSAFLVTRTGAPPFGSNLTDWVRASEARQSRPGLARHLLQGAARILCNLFYARQTHDDQVAAKAGAGAGAVVVLPTGQTESSMFGDLTLTPDPTLRDREAAWAPVLLPWFHTLGRQDYLVIPVIDETRKAHFMARSLGAEGLVDCLSDSASWHDIADKRPIASALLSRLGPGWKMVDYFVYRVGPSYAQVMRIAAIEQATTAQAASTSPTVQPAPMQYVGNAQTMEQAQSHHRSLRRRILDREFGG